ncbi:MAG TPA: CBS domain-containing protein [Thermodesulfobacteriota bacterium]
MRAETVEDRMQRGVFVCRRDTPADEAAAVMAGRDISALVVVDDDGRAVGVVSRTDLVDVMGAKPDAEPWRGLVVGAIMSEPVISVRADTPLHEAARLMREAEVHRLVVTRPEGGGEKPIGVLSVSDLVRPGEKPRRASRTRS